MAEGGVFMLIASGFCGVEHCCNPLCIELMRSLGYNMDSKWCHQHLCRLRFALAIPPYVKTRYIRLLELWREPKRVVLLSLYELSLNVAQKHGMLTKHILHHVVHERNVVIHRVFKRLLNSHLEFTRHLIRHRYACPGFGELSIGECSLNRYIDRMELYAKYKCPFQRLKFEIEEEKTRDLNELDYQAYNQFMLHESDKYRKFSHQCGYMRCICDFPCFILPEAGNTKRLKTLQAKLKTCSTDIISSKAEHNRAIKPNLKSILSNERGLGMPRRSKTLRETAPKDKIRADRAAKRAEQRRVKLSKR